MHEEDRWAGAVVSEMDGDVVGLNAFVLPIIEVRELT